MLDSAPRFADIRADTPDLQALEARYDVFQRRFADAASVEDALAVVHDWDVLRRELGTWSSLTELRFSQNTQDPQRKAALGVLHDLRPKITGFDVALKRALLASPMRGELERELGAYAFARWEIDVTAYDPVIEPFTVRESKDQETYTELLASARFEFDGQTLNLPQIAKYAEHPDRALREAAARTRAGFFEEHLDELDALYDRLVHVRDEMARELEYENFVRLGYRRLGRTDYGPEEVARYREEIVREIVPLAAEIARRQAADLGVDELRLWDEKRYDRLPPPRPPQGDGAVAGAARNALRDVSEPIGAFAGMMIDHQLLDLESREGKAGGGFCTSFPTAGVPFVFANFNGTTQDVTTLAHELGHAYQVYASQGKVLSDYAWPTLEACEIHSMSMEFFVSPQLRWFFGDDAPRYRSQHLRDAIRFLPYGAAIDHFQHFVYEHPDASPERRRAFWRELESMYLPWRRYGGMPVMEHGGYWQGQLHVYTAPFYYIDYTLAQCCALQFWARSLDDYEGALRDYMALCARGGERPFLSLVESAGLRSPFEPGVLRGVAERARAELEM